MIPQMKRPSFAGVRILLLLIFSCYFSVQSFAQTSIQIDEIDPTGKAGDLITVKGRGFDPNPMQNVVYFGGKVGTIASMVNSVITVRVPQGVDYDFITVYNKVTGYTATSREKFMPLIYPQKTGLIPRDFQFYGHVSDGSIGGALSDFLLMDVNRDGKPDIVSINGANMPPQISITTNTSSSIAVSFNPNTRFITSSDGPPISIASGDINRDGYPDLLVSTYGSSRIQVLLNTGDVNTMKVDTYIDAGMTPTTMTVADVNMDGLPDVLISDNTAGKLTMLQNNSTATNISFSAQSFGTSMGLKRIYIRDINYDGIPDIIGISQLLPGFHILEGGMSSGSFYIRSTQSYPLRETPSDIGFYDFIPDGRIDLAICYPNNPAISFYNNTTASGSSDFTFVSETPLPGSPTGISIADLNGDQQADLLISYANNFGNNTYRAGILLNKSVSPRVKFEPAITLETSVYPTFNAIADLNNDNKPDIIIASSNGHAYSVYQNNTSLAPQITSISPAKANTGSSITITGTNMNPAAANNLVTIGGIRATVTGLGTNSLIAQIPTGTALGPVTVTNVDNGLTATSRQQFHQTVNPSRNTLGKYDLRNANVPVSLAFKPNSLVAADLDNDGKLDLVASDNGNGSGVVNFAIIQNTTSSNTLSFRNGPVQTDTRHQSALRPSIADFDGDGKMDMVIPMINGTSGEVMVYPNAAIAGNWSTIAFNTTLLPEFSDVVDVDGDGLTDIVVAKNSTGEVGVLRNISTKKSEFKFATPSIFNNFNSQQFFSKLVDVDGDNLPDLITVGNDGLTVSLNKSTPGNINFSSAVVFPVKANPISVTFSDFDGNGTLDAIVYHTADILVCLNESTVGTVKLSTTIDVPVSKASANMSLGDINGDGYPDLISANQAAPWISAYPNLSATANKTYGVSTSSIDITDLNNAVAATVTGDFNGDGRTDVVAAIPGSSLIASYLANIVVAPAVQAKDIVISDKSATGATISWTNGDGEKRAVFINEGSSAASPIDLQEYAANTVFKAGAQIGNSGWYCVYNGAGNSVNISGLNTSANYTVKVTEYNTGGITGNTYYQTSNGNNNPKNFNLAGQSLICDLPVSTTTTITGVCLLCGISDPAWAIDRDTTNFSTMQFPPGVTGGLAQTFIFNDGTPTDTVTIKMDLPNVLPTADILRYIRLNSSNGSTNNVDLISLADAPSNLKVSIDGNTIYIKYAPKSNYDRFNLSIDGSGNNISSARIYYVSRMVASPVVTPNPAISCTGTPITLNASALNADIKWYDAATAGNLLAIGSNLTTGTVTGQQTLYAEATRTSSGCTNTVRTPVTVKLSTAPTIITPPANSTVNAGSTATFSVSTAETGLSYTWQEDTSSGFTNLAGVAPYAGVNTSSLSISPVSASMNGNKYRVIISNSCSQRTIADPAILTVNKKPQTLTFNTQTPNSNISATYGDVAINGAATSTSGLTVSYSSNNNNVATVDNAGLITFTGVGTAQITASQNGNNEYTAATAINFNVTVTAKQLTITAIGKSKVYGTADPTLTYNVSGLINNDPITGALTRIAGADVGSYAISQGSLSAGNNYIIRYIGNVLIITPANLAISADAKTKLYGAPDPTLTYNVIGLVGSDQVTGNLTRDAGTNIGNYNITLGTLSAGGNYTITYVGNKLNISPATLTITANAASKTYGASDPAFTYSINGLVNNDPIAGTLGRNIGENVGNYNITLGSLTVSNNYMVVFNANTMRITPATITIQADAKSKVYGTADPALTYTTSGLLNNDPITGSLGRNTGEDVGNYSITQGSVSAGNNYTIIFTSNDLNISPATLTINANPQSKVYGTGDPALTYTPTGLFNNDPITGTLSRNAGENVSNYSISQGSVSAGKNYTIVFNSNLLSIIPATLTINADAKSKIYGNGDPAFTYTTTGLVGNDQITGALTRNAGEDVGNYNITKGSLSAGNNYTVNFNGSGLNITPATITVTPDAKTKVYGSVDPLFTYTSTGLIGNDQIHGTLGRNAGENVGVYSITQGSLSAGNNYTISFLNNNLSITPATLTINADAKTKVYGSNDPALTYTATGLKNGDKLNGSLSRDAGENAGTYAINQGSINPGNNYTLTFTGNTFTITKATQTISWSQSLAIGCDNNKTIQLNATSNSGLPVSYSTSSNIATINGNTLTASGSGAAVITATQAGDNNYEATSISNNLTVMLPSMIRQHWNDVLLFDNSSNDYRAWQWYKNNSIVAGATGQYYSENGGLNGTYYVMATDKSGNTRQTCPLSVTSTSPVSGGISVSPNPVAKGAMATITCRYTTTELTGAILLMTDITGKTVDQLKTVLPVNQVKMPMNGGFYIITLMLSNGQRATTNVIVN
ncbi:IPT/TIG domain-containing protein [Chitinophaga dinghuensis]|uniref:IPT/TIG domain-containing protein n=1 Tax=Chitinophaga dinghuensis TaxID=1539050 RepID=A0A327W5T6_9BACT|nr:MBG domain-containing protein [Chitinophaga dinghuensis]RAJ83374.1 IPT/TIG domain-containing protein [Chitinophaga dinghuensis]